MLKLFISLVLVKVVGALYFEVAENYRRCFIEEVPASTFVTGTYKNLDYAKIDPRLNRQGGTKVMTIYVYDDQGREVMRHPMSEQGKFTFNSNAAGEHQVCFHLITTQPTATKFRVELSMNDGDKAMDYTEIAKQEHLSAIEVEVRKLNDKIRQLRKEQEYQKKMEMTYRDTSESTNSRVMWWSIIQTLILIGAGIWQVTKLKGFFKERKLA